MAIQFDPNALSMFSNVNFGDDDAIANLGGENNLVQKDTLGSFFWEPFRSRETAKRNNAVRTELLKALGQAFNLDGVTKQEGKTTFSEDFMDRLSDLLGPAFKREDFEIKDGVVASGKPLTQRRIKSIFKAAASVNAETPYDVQTYLAKAESIKDILKTKDPKAQTTITGYNIVDSIQCTIAFIEGDLPNFDEECKNINDHDQIVTFVGRKTKVGMYAEELDIVKPQANMAAQDDIFVYDSQDKRADIKTYIRNRLQEYVKNTIDICMAAARAGKLDECMMVYNNACCALKFIERDLEQFKRDNLVQDIQEQVLDKLEEFLAEDPYGNSAKIDKFCTYLENNGPAALHVADGKNVDLNWLFKQIVFPNS